MGKKMNKELSIAISTDLLTGKWNTWEKDSKTIKKQG